MPDELRLIVGLGNPGEQYENTWHNLGWTAVKTLAQRRNLKFKPGKASFLYAESGNLALMLPTCYMNRSGEPVSWWLNYYKILSSQILVISDDHDLPLGRLRLRREGSSGGHRGLEDIIEKIGSKQFPRLRIGINRNYEINDLAEYVLSPIPKSLKERILRIVNTAVDALETIEKQGFDIAMNIYNQIFIE